MKARLYGLLALMLCAMMVVMPVVAMGENHLVYSVAVHDNESTAVSEGDIILTDTVSFALGTEIRTVHIDYDVENTSVQDKETTSGFTLSNPMYANGADGWRVTSMYASGGELTLKLEAVRFAAYGTVDSASGAHIVEALNGIFNSKSKKHDTPSAIKDAFQNYATSEGYGEIVSFRDIKAYNYVDSSNDRILRETQWNGGLVRFTERLSPLNSATKAARLLHLKADDAIEDLPITIQSGRYSVELDSFSPFAIAYDPSNVSGGNGGGNGTTLPGGPGTAAPSGSTAAPNLPQTGDNSQLLLWSALALLSLTGAVLSIRRKKA